MNFILNITYQLGSTVDQMQDQTQNCLHTYIWQVIPTVVSNKNYEVYDNQPYLTLLKQMVANNTFIIVFKMQ